MTICPYTGRYRLGTDKQELWAKFNADLAELERQRDEMLLTFDEYNHDAEALVEWFEREWNWGAAMTDDELRALDPIGGQSLQSLRAQLNIADELDIPPRPARRAYSPEKTWALASYWRGATATRQALEGRGRGLLLTTLIGGALENGDRLETIAAFQEWKPKMRGER